MQQIPELGHPAASSIKKKMVLVTGGSGYLAGWIIVELLRQGYWVRTTVRSHSCEAAVRRAVEAQVNPQERLGFIVADLLKDDGWEAATERCDFVIHVASPMGQGDPKGTDLVRPAREGTLRVLKAAIKGGVQRMVLTSSTVAAKASSRDRKSSIIPANEDAWTDPAEKGLGEYGRSKTLAERAAWEFAEQSAGAVTMTTILPGMILGPVMTENVSGSVEVISRMLTGRVPALPRIGFSIVDVRDLADLHLRAMISPQAAGQRFLGVSDFLWMKDIAKLLRESFGEEASKVPTRHLPDFVLRVAALFQEEARFMAPLLGRRTQFDVSKAANLLHWHPRPAAEAVLNCAEDLIRKHLV